MSYSQPTGGSEEVRSPEEEEGGDDSPLAAAFKAKRRDLKPTEVSSGPSILAIY